MAWEHVIPTIPGVDLVHGILGFFARLAKTLGLSLAFWRQSADEVYRSYLEQPVLGYLANIGSAVGLGAC